MYKQSVINYYEVVTMQKKAEKQEFLNIKETFKSTNEKELKNNIQTAVDTYLQSVLK